MSEDLSELTRQFEIYEQVQVDADREALERDLYAFVQKAWHLVEQLQPFTPNWHVQTLCKILQETVVGKGESRRLVVNVPPGTMKSLLVSVFFPVWVWTKHPQKRFLCASYGQHLTSRDNVRARQIIDSRWFQDRWPVKMLEDQNTKTRYNTTENGWRIATSVGGQGLGEHPDFIIIDDPLTDQQAQSKIERQTALDWFDRTMATRLGRNPAIILIMQRLHQEDLSGHLLRRGGWKHINWPMEYEVSRPPTEDDPLGYTADPTDERTVKGELLFPKLFPREKVELLKTDLGAYGAAGQLQQRPVPEGGAMFMRGWFALFLDAMPKDVVRIVRGWDTASSEGSGDYTVGVKIAETRDGKIILQDVVRGQWGPAGVDTIIQATARGDGKRCPVRIEREGGASGKAQTAAFAKLLLGYDFKEQMLGSNKQVRAQPLRAAIESGQVYMLRGAWNQAFITELCDFPTGQHDDQVDAASCAFNALLLEPKKRKYPSAW